MIETHIYKLRKIALTVILLVVSIVLSAQEKLSDREQALLQRVQETQLNGSDTDFYKANEAYLDYLRDRKEWGKYYRTWMYRVIRDVNHRHFHRAFLQIQHIKDDIEERHQGKYLYITNMGLGFFYNGRHQPELGEKFFRRALQGIDVNDDPVAVFNAYL